MSKAEKRHFKLYAQTGKKSPPKYVKLFDLINQQEAYDEQATRENGFKSDDKNLLMEKLLDSAHVMQLHKSADNELRLLLDYFSILEKKNHWKLLGKYIKKAKQLAKENERFDVLLDILKCEQRLAYKTAKIDFGKRMGELVEEKKEVLAQLNDEMQYYDLSGLIEAVLLRDRQLSKPENRAKFNRLMSSPLLRQDTKPLSQKAMIDYCYIKSLYHKDRMEYEQTYQYYELIIEVLENNPFLFHIRAPAYGGFM